MAALPTNRLVHGNKLRKYYLWRYLYPCEKHFGSKDSDDKGTLRQENKNNQNKDESKSQPEQSLDTSLKTKVFPDEKVKDAAKKKLFSLLSELKVSPNNDRIRPDLVLSKAIKRPSKKERFKHLTKEKTSPDEKMKLAVDAVAESLGGDTNETQMKLNEKLQSLNLIQKQSDSEKQFKSDDLGIDEKLQENLMSSVQDVASTVETPVKSKLAERLMRLSIEKKGGQQAKIPIQRMIKGMKITENNAKVEAQDKKIADAKPKERKIAIRSQIQTRINIFQSPPLGIFSLDKEKKTDTQETLWQSLEKKRLKLLTEFAPSNAFEEMIMWTEQGKHWKFPIDNEIDMGEEENVGFQDHVFLEQHLHDFPTRGPIRHFMELVTIGLSKNPYITVERKIENIEWFRKYFKEKEDILKQYGALN